MLLRARYTAIVAFVATIIFGLCAYAFPAAASPDSPGANVLLARLCVNEAGWNTLDCAAIGHIRARSARANGRTLEAELQYQHGARSLRSDRASRVDPRDARPWIGDLTGVQPPRHWPTNLDWRGSGLPRWADVLDVATAVIAGTERDPCRAGRVRPNTWGGPRVDADRLARPGWQEAHCGPTANRFGRWGGAAPESADEAPTAAAESE